MGALALEVRKSVHLKTKGSKLAVQWAITTGNMLEETLESRIDERYEYYGSVRNRIRVISNQSLTLVAVELEFCELSNPEILLSSHKLPVGSFDSAQVVL